MSFRIGQGYDVHPLVADRSLVIGGETIPFDRGLDGFSDADVVLHALGDALLGAVGLGDLGTHFPPGDPEWQDADSVDLLLRIVDLVGGAGFGVVNCDLTIIAEEPRMAPHIDPMRRRIARILAVDDVRVSIKATTHERLGTLGRGEGIACLAVVLVESTG